MEQSVIKNDPAGKHNGTSTVLPLSSPRPLRLLPQPIHISGLITASSYENEVTPDGCTDTSAIEPQFVRVPGAYQKAYISRQVLLAQIALSLGLTIHSTGIVSETISELRGWIEIDMIPSTANLLGIKQKFYGTATKTIYSAMENAALAVIEHMIQKDRVAVDDANYKQTIVLQNKLAAATSFESIYRESNQTNLDRLASVKKCNEFLLHQIQKICIDHASILPLKVCTSHGKKTAFENIDIQYIGHTPPITLHEKLAFKLARLSSIKNATDLSLLHTTSAW